MNVSALPKMKTNMVWALAFLLIISVGVRLPGLLSRSIWYDETITLLETAGNAYATWPNEPTLAVDAKNEFIGTPSLMKIATDLRKTDIHPPLYYWLLSGWRQMFGVSLEAARFFSLLCSVGSVFALYLLLHHGKVKHPLIISSIYAISTGAVFAGHETRAYALAGLFIGLAALFAYLSTEGQKNRLVFAVGLSIFGGLAFQTNYLALFPVGFVFLWFVVVQWRQSKWVAMIAPLVGIGIWLIGVDSFLPQLSARKGQEAGFPGLSAELSKLLDMNLNIAWNVVNLQWALLFVFLLGVSFFQIYRHWSQINQKLMLLIAGLGFSPSVGLIILDVLFDKNLSQGRYLIFAGPGLITMLVYGVSRRAFLRYLLILVVGLQLTAINWGQEQSEGWPGTNLRSAAATVAQSSSSHVVIVGAGYGRGFPGSVIYELSDETMVVVVGKGSDLERVTEAVLHYNEVWFFRPREDKTAHIEDALLAALQASGRYTNEIEEPNKLIHLWN